MSKENIDIFLVFACIHYEGGTVISAFTSESDANEFMVKCQEYDKTFIDPPNTEIDGALYDAWDKQNILWFENQPSKYPYTDYYSVKKIALNG